MHVAQHPGHRSQAVALQADGLQEWQACQTTRQTSIRDPASYTSASIDYPALNINKKKKKTVKVESSGFRNPCSNCHLQNSRAAKFARCINHNPSDKNAKAQHHQVLPNYYSPSPWQNLESECGDAGVVQGIKAAILSKSVRLVPYSTPAPPANLANRLQGLQILICHLHQGAEGGREPPTR